MNKLMMYNTCIVLLIAVSLCSCNAPSSPAKKETGKKTIMAIFAHPDDEVDVSPLLAKLAKKGHNVYLVVATRGDVGVTDHAKIPAGDSLANVRTRETICSNEVLGILPPVMLGLGDGALTNRPTLAVLNHRIDSVITKYKPDIVITWGPDGGSGHPDHRMVGNVVSEIYQSGQHSSFDKLFYTGIPTENWNNPPKYSTELGNEVHTTYHTVKREYLTTRIKCDTAEIEQGIRAMYCYKSQYTEEEMKDNRLWTLYMNRDTVYLRTPYASATQDISYDIFE